MKSIKVTFLILAKINDMKFLLLKELVCLTTSTQLSLLIVFVLLFTDTKIYFYVRNGLNDKIIPIEIHI